ncbi:glycoside hydrolase family 18 protein [Mycena maculata]|uniref:chitinase n=1 Tax=Mycena maculata TaxID=230809 RepID=A0AAD7IWD2_9AGAR|nr:glycoside hydrolase family 18 protein [Mycena maculata]
MFSSVFSFLVLSAVSVVGLDLTRTDNLAVYWGQNSYGLSNPSDPANWQQTISTYCQDSIIDIIPIAPSGGAFPGTGLANCQFLAAGIEACQAAGKAVTISLGVGSGAAFTSDAEAVTFAGTIWDLFLGGSSSTRPFGPAVLDGVDLDIESGDSTGFAAFAAEIRSLTAGASKPYYLTAAPQCPFPDASVGSAINAVGFDAVFVQFYNNNCGVSSYPTDFDFGTWDTWAKTVSPNPNVKVFIGAPAAEGAANLGQYVDAATLGSIALATRAQYSSFGGVMLWDASQAYANDRYDIQIKDIIATTSDAGVIGAAGGAEATTSSSAKSVKASAAAKSSQASSATPVRTGEVKRGLSDFKFNGT